VRPLATYAVALGVGATLSLALTPLALRTALRLDAMDRPGAHKSHGAPIPYLGGLAIVLGFVVAVTVGTLLRPDTGGRQQLAAILGVALVVALIGLLDDLKGLPVAIRFGAELAAALTLWGVGVRVSVTQVVWLDLAITVVWVIGITNAMNLLDNMDGLSALTATVAALGFGTIAALNGRFLVAALSFALAGAAVGFLRDNRPPARIYMGDAGSLFLGVMLAAIGIQLRVDAHPINAALVPILVLTVPVLDTTLVTVSRLRHGVSPFQGGRDHTSHRLTHIGLPVPIAVGLIGVAGLAHAWMALIVSRVDVVTGLIAAALTFALDAVLFVLLARVPVYENSRGPDLVISQRGA
jgi:UDP-GlcNAc:undecaprenyl-phosphate/decaprenyl-phosphate GlcNAc-1-phosphate transferase